MMSVKTLLLIILLVIPLYIILSYEGKKLQLMDQTPIKIALPNTLQKLKILKEKNQQSMQIKKYKIQKLISQKRQIKDKSNKLYDQTLNQQLPLPRLNSYYQSHFILNVQISSGYFQQSNQIQELVMKQLDWLIEQFDMRLNLVRWQNSMNLSAINSSLIVVFRQFKMESVDQNVALKLKQGQYKHSFYLKEIVQQLRSLPSFSHCKFTNRACEQATILIVKHNNQRNQDAFWEADSEIYFLQDFKPITIFNVLGSIFNFDSYLQLGQQINNFQLLKQFYQLRIQQNFIQEYQLALTYITYIIKQRKFDFQLFNQKLQHPEDAINYIKNGQFISPYVQTQKSINKMHHLLKLLQQIEKGSRLDHSIIDDEDVGAIDSFPNDFKIGVYLPLLVIFMYPLFMIRP